VEPPKGIPRPKVVKEKVIMSEHEVIGRQVMRIQELENQTNALLKMIHSIKSGELDLNRIELRGNGFTINNEDEVIGEEK
jgi:hypothetical protein